MSPDKIQKNLQAARSRPFTIRLSDGQVLKVLHTDYVRVAPDGRQIALFTEGSDFALVDTAYITSMEFSGSDAAKEEAKSEH